ncbi:hypothetical protein Ocin01_06585 [Orchesella cincta]|uniref:Uncharacterized protein n=1 Tax=Orchesella cincta TaxID=48709 RepID=A0A1D2N553_ORCCI|nr:hypothetical protein Ocin01_06585 [Orchesella cincta]
MDSDLLQEAIAKTDFVVLKRLKFIFKIIKALTAQPNSRNRQVHVYVLEVLDAIGDWSGKENADVTDLLDRHLFPQICRLIATLSKDEFQIFQQFFVKYLLVKWEETSNFICTLNPTMLRILSLLICLFYSIAPFHVVEEYIEVFTRENMPPHIKLIILPSIIRNLKENAAADLSDRLSTIDNLRLPQKKEISKAQLTSICQFWKSLVYINASSAQKITPLLYRCVLTASYLNLLNEIELSAITQSLTEWSEGNTSLNAFLLASSIFLPAVAFPMLANLQGDIKSLIERVAITVKGCKNSSVRNIVISVLQRLLEHAEEDIRETVDNLMECYDIDKHSANVEVKNADDVLQTMETCVKRILNEPDANSEESNRKRIKLMIDSLHQIY